MPQKQTVPAWPRIEARTRPDGTGEITINGTSHPVGPGPHGDVIDAILARSTETAAKVRRPVRVTTSGHDGDWRLIVHPDGHVEEDGPQPEQKPRQKATPPPPAPRPQAAPPQQPAPAAPPAPGGAQTGLEALLAQRGRADGSRAWTDAAEAMASRRDRPHGQ